MGFRLWLGWYSTPAAPWLVCLPVAAEAAGRRAGDVRRVLRRGKSSKPVVARGRGPVVGRLQVWGTMFSSLPPLTVFYSLGRQVSDLVGLT